jgi:predicted regulator of Ras-like GTPase activity (Roadblock/LC7/MglB family)
MANLREKKIQEILSGLRKRTNIHYSNLFTEDGFIVAIDQANQVEDEDYHRSISAICATILALAENGTELVKEGCRIKEISIQAGDQLDTEGFTIILESISNDIKLSVIFTSFLNLGLILFELNQTIHKLLNYLAFYQYDENSEKIGALY